MFWAVSGQYHGYADDGIEGGDTNLDYFQRATTFNFPS